MTRQEALKRLQKRFGSKLGYRVDPRAPSPDEREQARAELPALTKAKQEAEAAMRERRRVLLLDPEYQRLTANWQAAKKASEATLSLLHHFKFTVGTSEGIFFRVEAQGDSWEEIFTKLNGGKP